MSIQEDNLTAIANAIREKEGTEALIPAETFAARILALATGGLPEGTRTITVQSGNPEWGAVAGGGIVSDGMTITVTASPNDRRNFVGWQENGETVSTDKEYTFSVDRDVNLTAVFSASNLPQGYTDLEYIVSNNSYIFGITKSQYLLTKFELGVELDFTNAPTTIPIAFSQASNSRGYWYGIIYYDTNGICFGSGYNPNVVKSNVNPNGILNIEYDANNGIGIINGVETSFSFNSSNSKYACVQCPLFASGYYSTSTSWQANGYFKGKIFYAKLYINGELKRNYVPCLRNSDGVAGLYDLVSNSFFKSSNANNFEAGPVI